MDASPAHTPGAPFGELLRHQQAGERRQALQRTLDALAGACAELSLLIRRTGADPSLGAATSAVNSDGDVQKGLDVLANEIVLKALRNAPVAYFASEEEEGVLTLDPKGALAVAVDPLDGSSNIDTNAPIGTIFGIYAASPGDATASFFRPGRELLAAGYCIYGPHTALALSVGHGTHMLLLLDEDRSFRLQTADVAIPPTTTEYAINASNYRQWHDPVRQFVDDCVAGREGPRGKDFNMRWLASLVGDTHRIMKRGGVFLYPADQRKGYEHGRLRLVYEAAPIALLVEQAGGLAIDGEAPILDKVPATLHERTPLIFGSADKVRLIERYHCDPAFARDQSPLFGRRGLFTN